MQLPANIFLILLLSTQLALAAPPSATTSEYLATTGGGFTLNGDEVLYRLNLSILKELPKDAVLRFEFQNPANKRKPITTTATFEIEEDAVSVHSTPVDCIRNSKRYTATVEIYEDASAKKPLSRHVQKLEFFMPPEFLKSRGVNTC